MQKEIITLKRGKIRNTVAKEFASSGKRSSVIPPKRGKGCKYNRSKAKHERRGNGENN